MGLPEMLKVNCETAAGMPAVVELYAYRGDRLVMSVTVELGKGSRTVMVLLSSAQVLDLVNKLTVQVSR